MESENQNIVKGIFEEMLKDMPNLKQLTIKIRMDKEGEVVLDYSTANQEEKKKKKKKNDSSDEDEPVKKGKSMSKPILKNLQKERKKTKF